MISTPENPRNSLEEALGRLDSISLEAMGKVRLMNRVDTKYLTTVPVLVQLLEMAAGDYYVQEIDGRRNMPYATCYFDTEGCFMFHEHQRGRKTRQKVRIREYVGSDAKFLEVKSKNNKGRTKKKRVAIAPEVDTLTGNDEFLLRHTPWDSSLLIPKLQNSFMRITLVDKQMTERLTIDTALSFHNLRSAADRSLEGLVIIELKRNGLSQSPIFDIFRKLRIHPHSFSKYCMGMAFTDGSLRQNRLKEKLRHVDRLCLRTDTARKGR